MKNERYLVMESPQNVAVVDFLTAGALVTLTVENGSLEINVKVPHGEGASSWDEQDFAMPLCKEEP